MEDLIQVAVIVAILLVSLLGGGKRKRAQAQRRAQTRARPTPPPQPQRTTRPRAHPAGTQRVEPQRQQGLEAILDLLRGELPSALEPEPPPQDLGAAGAERIDDEARPVETLKPLDEESHAAFHERYVEPGPEVRPVRVKRYRLTPKTAREAVVWTAIFSPPKGYE